MKTNKKKYIEAMKKTIHLYELLDPSHSYFDPDTCHLCLIYPDNDCLNRCEPCPLSNYYGYSGCCHMESFVQAQKSWDYKNQKESLEKKKTKKAFLNRAKVLRKALCIMKRTSEKHFTKKGWTSKSFEKIRNLG